MPKNYWPSMIKESGRMLADIGFVLVRWRVVHLLALSTLRARYARSKFGQMWLSISTFVMIFATAMVWSLIWGMPLDEYLPYVGVGHIVYTFLSQMITESTGILVADARLYLNERMPSIISVAAHFYRSLIVLLHNTPTAIGLLIWSTHAHLGLSLLFPVAIMLAVVFLIMSSYVVALLCARFRDLIQIVGLVMQILFLLSPVMWKVEFMPEQYRDYVYINPFAAFLEVLRNPIVGAAVNDIAYYSLLGWSGFLCLVALLVHRTLERRIIFWL